MLLASKYEEMYAPEVQDFVFITDDSFSGDQIRTLERKMLKVLDYSFGTPLCLHFLRRYSRAGEVSSMEYISVIIIIIIVFMKTLDIAISCLTGYPSNSHYG